MFTFYYQKYKIWVWGVLTIALASGAVSKAYRGKTWEVGLNAFAALICFVIFITLWINRNKK